MLNEDVVLNVVLFAILLSCVLPLLFLFWTLGRYAWLRHKRREVSLALRVRVDGFRSLYGKVVIGFSALLLIAPWLALLLYISILTRFPVDIINMVFPWLLLCLSFVFLIRTAVFTTGKRRFCLYTNDPGKTGTPEPQVTKWMIIKRELLLYGTLFASAVVLWVTMAVIRAFITEPVFYIAY